MNDATIKQIYFCNTERLAQSELAETCLIDLLGVREVVTQQNRLSKIVAKQLSRNETLILLGLMKEHDGN